MRYPDFFIKRLNTYFYILISVALIALSSGFYTYTGSASKQLKDYKIPLLQNDSIHITFGIPVDTTPSDDYIILRQQYCISYNYLKGIPNWVSWELNSDWFGNVPRYKGNFITDESLPDSFYKVTHKDYTNSGFDRGHCVRSEERTKTIEDNKATFVLTNILPQTADLNRGVWLEFEYFCENLCKKYNKELFLICGGFGFSGSSLNNKCKVAIPDTCFKILLIFDKKEKVFTINKNTSVIAIAIPNISGIRKTHWQSYQTTIRNIENSSGYNFLPSLPSEIQDNLENKIMNCSIK